MATLTIRRGAVLARLDFRPPERLEALLAAAGLAPVRPCGGRGVCGKCAVLLTGEASAPNEAETRCGVRLACQVVVTGDAEVILPEVADMRIEAEGAAVPVRQPMPGRYGAAVDIGTTTLALRLHDLRTGDCLSVATLLNPQVSVAADVIGRIDAALHGRLFLLQEAVSDAVATLLRNACARAEVPPEDVRSLVVAGNTTMLTLLTGRNPASLARAPFQADCLFGMEENAGGRRCYLPPCLHAFVGADTTCAIVASGMTERGETALLIDVGTNGEIALWRGGQLYITSTAAGPAFEGAGITCGCGSVPGAIDRVTVGADGKLCVHTIGDLPAVGLCGSGLVDAVAALLETGVIDETGAMEEAFPLASDVILMPRDVRALQLAKAAMAAGVDSLLRAAACPPEEVAAVYLAGGFGSHMNLDSAGRIGLLAPALAARARVIGNAALHGASLLLADMSLRKKCNALQHLAQHVRLDGNAYFARRYVECMLFDADD